MSLRFLSTTSPVFRVYENVGGVLDTVECWGIPWGGSMAQAVAWGDIDSDGIDEILVGAGPGADYDAWVLGYNYDGGTLEEVIEFTAFDRPAVDVTHGVNLAVGQF